MVACHYQYLIQHNIRGRRLAKSFLKDQRTSLTLWNAYAQMEKSHDRMDEVCVRVCGIVIV